MANIHINIIMVGVTCSGWIVGMGLGCLLRVFRVFFLCLNFLVVFRRWKTSALISSAYFPNNFFFD